MSTLPTMPPMPEHAWPKESVRVESQRPAVARAGGAREAVSKLMWAGVLGGTLIGGFQLLGTLAATSAPQQAAGAAMAAAWAIIPYVFARACDELLR